MHNVHVSLDKRSYDIHIGSGLIEKIASLVPVKLENKALFVVTDENIATSYGRAVYEALKRALPASVQLLALPPGEPTKCWAMLERVMNWMLDNGAGRDSVLFAVGGGVIGDLGGFAAALALRGIAYVQVPTSLLAQVDSSVGGKTAIDMDQGKNLVGAFHQPCTVVCDANVLKTLPRRELMAGYAEIVKYGLIGDAEFFEWLEKHGKDVCALDPKAVAKAVEVSCRKKAEIVARDETEQGERMLLNLGHTFGHALEAASGYDGRQILHGEAVAIGMVLAYRLSVHMGLCPEKDARRVEAHLASIGLPTAIAKIFPPLGKTEDEIIAYMKRDKKAMEGNIRFILTRGIGEAFVSDDVTVHDVRHVISQSMKVI